MDAKATVLVVDDDPAILELMRDFLENDGYHVQAVPSGPDALRALASAPVDCLLLDIMMPGQSGFDLCRHIRDTCDVPILFLSARDADADKIRGLGLGGDDYIVKSATPSEVVARVKAVLRRTQRWAAPPLDILDYGRLVLDVRAHEVRIAGQPVAFAAREFELLQLLAEHPRQLFTYNQLFERFWGEYGDRHTVAVHVGRIRQKIEADPAEPHYIVTVWGVGYRFEGARQ